ncbi:MAG: peptide chain release factor N(5)-glutamine methyltransferase [Alphaproteobacteria bacterium]|nr:peptide chain release factor N(5)-glutamine methyltransferase [Alphaproteobacteria bacterium]
MLKFLCHHIFMIDICKTYTVEETLKTGKTYLKDAGVESFDLDAKVLLSFVLGMESYELISHSYAEVPLKFYHQYMKLLRRRGNSEPVAQITKHKEFWSLPFKISKKTLIPRPDSETMIEAVKSEFKDKNFSYRILDMGTGSGCLLLSLLSEFKQAFGIGIDIQSGAVKTARENAKLLSLDDRAVVLKQSWHKKRPVKKITAHKFHIIISNPPYITGADMKTLAKDVKKFEPRRALFGGRDGLDEYRMLSQSIYDWEILERGGRIFLELGRGQENDVKRIFEAFGFKFEKYFKDLSGIIRVIEFSKK